VKPQFIVLVGILEKNDGYEKTIHAEAYINWDLFWDQKK
jgi:hypothetical protein